MGKFLALIISGAVIAIVVSITSLILSNIAAFILFLAMIAVVRTEEFALKLINLCERVLSWAENQNREEE